MGNKTTRSQKAQKIAGDDMKFDGPSYLVSITVTQGRDLAARDLNGRSDPYVILDVGGHTCKTSVIKRNLNPVWNERIEVIVRERPTEFQLICMDHDKASKDDLIGKAVMTIQEEEWDNFDAKFYDIPIHEKGGKGKKSGELQVQMNYRTLDPADELATYYAVSHYLRVHVHNCVGLPRMDNIGKNDNVVNIAMGTQNFRTKVAKGLNPVFDQSAWLYLSESNHQNYKIKVKVMDLDAASKDDQIGAVYIDVGPLFDLIEPEMKTLPLNSFIFEKDAQLEQQQEGEHVGDITLTFELFTKDHVEKTMIGELMKLVAMEDEKHDQKEEPEGLTKTEIASIILMIDPHMKKKTFDDLWENIDVNNDGILDSAEVLNLLRSSKFRFLGANFLALWHGDEDLEGNLLDNLMSVESTKKSSEITLKERTTGLIVHEKIPGYIKMAMRLMYSSSVTRGAASLGSSKSILKRMSVSQGEKYEQKESVDEIPGFVELHNLNTDEFDRPMEEYENFNQFFARELRDIEALRPLGAPEDNSVAVSPADCRMTVFPELVDATKYWIKGKDFTVPNLLGEECYARYGEAFMGGSLCIARLAPQDYHRWHTPVTGTFGEMFPLEGALYTVNPVAINKPVNVYTENKRTVCLIDSAEFGAIILIAVGATMVGTMEIFGQPGAECLKGEQHGKFLFGGSTVLLLFQPGAIRFDEDLLENSLGEDVPVETLIRVRQSIGVAQNAGRRLADF